MGLDQYLYAERYISTAAWRGQESNTLFEQIESTCDIAKYLDKSLQGDDYQSGAISFKVGYWRKANQIHKWFVDNCQDGDDNCAKYYIDRERLSELKQLCDEVLADKSKANDLLPVQEGFFFGSTEYDEWYFKDVDRTSKLIGKLLETPADWEFYYQSSW